MGFWETIGTVTSNVVQSTIDAIDSEELSAYTDRLGITETDDIISPTGAGVQFPSDFGSYGGFFTKITVYKWLDKPAQGPAQVSSTDQVMQGVMWLPYPTTLTANYSGNFADAEGMHGIGEADGGIIDKGKKLGMGGIDAATKFLSFENENFSTSSAKMASKTIKNNKIGTTYNGQVIRTHNFSWKLMPKNAQEQQQIAKAVKMFKLISTPGVGARKDLNILMNEESSGITNSANVQGNLNIPMTIRMEFYQGTDITGGVGGLMLNPGLFKVKDAFITSVESNFTPTGMWNAFYDGTPLETSITISLKEIGALTQTDIINGA
jgi:hypothetical protein